MTEERKPIYDSTEIARPVKSGEKHSVYTDINALTSQAIDELAEHLGITPHDTSALIHGGNHTANEARSISIILNTIARRIISDSS